MSVVGAALPLRGGADGPIQTARRHVVFPLQGIAKTYLVFFTWPPVDPVSTEQIVQRRRRKTLNNGARGEVASTDQHRAVLIAIFKGTKKPEPVFFYWTTNSDSDLLTIERWRFSQTAIKGSR